MRSHEGENDISRPAVAMMLPRRLRLMERYAGRGRAHSGPTGYRVENRQSLVSLPFRTTSPAAILVVEEILPQGY